MVRVTFYLRRAAQVTFDEQSGGEPSQGHCCGIEQRLAGDEFLWRADVRHNLLGRQLGASGETGERCRCPHESQNFAAADAIALYREFAQEFIMERITRLCRSGKLLHAPP